MQRLIEVANNQISEYLDSKGIKHDGKFNCMGTYIDWQDIPDDLDLSGYEVVVINRFQPDCHLSIIFSHYRNRVNIKLPPWIVAALRSIGEV